MGRRIGGKKVPFRSQNFFQSQAGPGNPGFYRAQVQVQCRSDLLVGQAGQLPHDQNFPLVVGQRPQSLLHRLLGHAALGLESGVRLVIGGLPVALPVLSGERGCLQLPAALAAAEVVNAGVAGETVHPGGETALPLKGGQSPPGVEKGLLGRVLGVLRVAQHP